MLSDLEKCLSRFPTRTSAERIAGYLNNLFEDEAPEKEKVLSVQGFCPNEDPRVLIPMRDSETDQETAAGTENKLAMNSDESFSKRKAKSRRWLGLGVVALLVVVAASSVLYSLNNAGNHLPPNLQKAIEAMQKEEYGKALQLFDEIAATRPKALEKFEGMYADAMLQQGTRLSADDPHKAIELLNNSIKLNPENPKTYFELGILRARLNQHRKSIFSFKRATELAPDFADAFYNLGLAFERINKFAKSEKAFLRAASLSPPYLDEVYLSLGRVQRAEGKDKASVASLEKALAVNSHNERASRLLKRIMQKSQ
jgi:tetratricopeptide (TPR) repeat protein